MSRAEELSAAHPYREMALPTKHLFRKPSQFNVADDSVIFRSVFSHGFASKFDLASR